MRRVLAALVTAGFVSGLSAQVATGDSLRQDWPNWRGPNHDGISPEKGFETKWNSPPLRLWSQDIGSAFSGLSCVADRVYTCGTADKQQMLFCLAANTGSVLWKTPIEEEYRERQGGDGTRTTPTVDDGRVYILGALGRLLCVDAETGIEIWSRQLDGKPQWGYAGSVLVEGDRAIVPAGGKDGSLLALDKKSGRTLWQCGDAPVGYATPYPFTFDGRRCVVGFLAKRAIVADVQSGQEVWSTDWKTDWDVNAASPIFHDGCLFLSSGYSTGSAVFKLARDGDRLKADQAWGVNKIVLGKFQSAVLHEGYLYVSDEKALKCVEFMTGREKWSERGISNGTVVLADGHLIVLTEDGELQIARASPEKYEPTTKAKVLDGRCWTVPTRYQGRLYVRNFKQAACYKLTRG